MFKKEITKQVGLTYGDLLDRYVLLSGVKGLDEAINDARVKNLMELRVFERMNAMGSRIPVTPEFRSYQKEVEELKSKHYLTDSAGKAVLTKTFTGHDQYENLPTIDIADPKFILAFDLLKKKYQAAIKEREDDNRLYREFMLAVVPEKELPNVTLVKKPDGVKLTQEQHDAVYWFLQA